MNERDWEGDKYRGRDGGRNTDWEGDGDKDRDRTLKLVYSLS